MSNEDHNTDIHEGIAIIGIAAKLPGAPNTDVFWDNLCNGIESISNFSDKELINSGIDKKLIKKSNYIKAAGIIENSDKFDANFFGYSPREAEFMDPQHRLFLECAWNSLEDAGYTPENYDGSIGVFGGCGLNYYLLNNLVNSDLRKSVGDFQLMIGNDKDFLTTRVSYKMNLTGPSFDIQTGCSTSLAAVHIACQNLLGYECDMALAGGISLRVPQIAGYLYQEGTIMSADGKCRPFDKDATGTVVSEGVGIVVLKRLEDAINDNDSIYAVIKGSAINNDGSAKAGYTTPSVEGQSDVILSAQSIAEFSPETISYIEAHGTGTILGDPIEMAALTKTFQTETDKKNFCAIGSVKSNIGHLDIAAGIAGLIKTALSIKKGKIPPSINYNEPNEKLNIESSPFYINNKLSEWPNNFEKRRAGVSSFGIGGTNVHVVLEQAPEQISSESKQPWFILPLSSKTEIALNKSSNNLFNFLKKNSHLNIADIAYTLQTGRKNFDYKQFIICKDTEDAINVLENNNHKQIFNGVTEIQNPPVVFMFTGQGSQYVNMAYELYLINSYFREKVDYCSKILKEFIDIDIKDIIYPKEDNINDSLEKINQTLIAQPAIFIIEYALAKLIMKLGISPESMIGHSLGEYTAACISGVFDIKDTLKIISTRAKLMQSLPSGLMLSVNLPAKEITPYLNDKISLAVINAPSLSVVSGPKEEITSLKDSLEKKNIACQILHTSHAFHSHMMDPMLDEYKKFLSTIKINKPQIPYITNVTGTWIKPEEATSPDHWCKHLRQTVNFSDGIIELLQNKDRIVLEIGPGNTLCSVVSRNSSRTKFNKVLFSTIRHPLDHHSDISFLKITLGKLWLHGIKVDWEKLYSSQNRLKINLPGYQFDSQKYWIKPNSKFLFEETIIQEENKNYKTTGKNISALQSISKKISSKPGLNHLSIEDKLSEIWSDILGIKNIDANDNFFDLGGHSVLATQLIYSINQKFNIKLSLRNLFFSPTVLELTRSIKEELHISDENDSENNDLSNIPILFPVQKKGSKTPFYLVAGAHENRYYDVENVKNSYEEDFLRYMSNIVAHISQEQPIYGFRPKGIFINEKPHSSVEEMATAYIKEIKSFQPEGPYLIGGECVGGIIAYEMARQLLEQGEQISHLILMDTFKPTLYFSLKERFTNRRRTYTKYIIKIIKYMIRLNFRNLFNMLYEDFKTSLFIFFPFTKRMREQRRVLKSSFTYLKTLLNYRVKSKLPIKNITLIINKNWHKKNKTLGWPKNFSNDFNIKIVPGDHISRLTTYGHITGEYIKNAINNKTEQTK